MPCRHRERRAWGVAPAGGLCGRCPLFWWERPLHGHQAPEAAPVHGGLPGGPPGVLQARAKSPGFLPVPWAGLLEPDSGRYVLRREEAGRGGSTWQAVWVPG